jgi:hypothetical protein
VQEDRQEGQASARIAAPRVYGRAHRSRLDALTGYARRLLVNIDVFASARTQGVEFEAQGLPSDRLRLSATASYIDAYYLDYNNGPPTLAQRFQEIESRDL